MATQRVTIQDIARKSGVSTGTVSRVLNGHTTVAERTREQVTAVIAQLGYTPDPAARHLSWRTGQTLGVSLDADDPRLHPYQVLFRRALDAGAADLGLRVLDVGPALSALPRLPSAVLVMHARDGDPRPAFLHARGVPAVVVGRDPACSWVVPDDRGGARQAARALLDAGHRQLAYLGAGPSQVACDREAGFRAAVVEAGLQVLSLESDFTALGGYRAVMRAWMDGARFTGLFAQSDESAAGAVVALSDLGLRVPADVSVVGFDGLPELPLPGPLAHLPLTTVAQDIPLIARTALTLVQEAVNGLPPRGETIPVTLIPGATVAPPGGTP